MIRAALDQLGFTMYAAKTSEDAVERLRRDTFEVAIVDEQFQGGSALDNAGMTRGVLQGEQGPRRDVVLLNAAAALVVSGQAEDLREGLEVARQAIDSGHALAVLEHLVAFTNEAA